jgi:putative transposase
VFCPKYRYRIFKDGVGEYTKQEIYRLCGQKDQVEVLELNVQPDHVHLVVSIPPKYAVSAFMGYRTLFLRNGSTILLFHAISGGF